MSANLGLPTWETRFTADGEEYSGRFAKIALNVARRPGRRQTTCTPVLQWWFGPSAGHPGTDHYVDLGRAGRVGVAGGPESRTRVGDPDR
ncbi:MAG TPA: hypothetical protein VNC22_08305 [Sporichthya sp.]|nr:hypothetical protein [Sporichthya sp.]